jgi:hypothetical protein
MDNVVTEKTPQLANSRLRGLNPLMVIVLIIGVLVGAAGTAIYFTLFSGTGNTEGSVAQNIQVNSTVDENAQKKFRSSFAGFESSIDELKISDALALEFKNNPTYSSSASALLADWPSFEGSETPEAVKLVYIAFLKRAAKISNFPSDSRFGISGALGRLLDMLSYMAGIGNSPLLSAEEKFSWKNSVEKGKVASLDLVDIALINREEVRIFTEDIFRRKEFTDLGL